jgi:PAS domain S-box-containing protein
LNPSKSISVLLVDDDQDEYFLLKETVHEFRRLSVRLDWISSVDKAKKSIVEGHYDVYLIDYKLTGITGIELIEDVRKEKEQLPEVFILLTGLNNDEIEDRALEHGVDDFLSKEEITPRLLERTLVYSIDRKQTLMELTKRKNQYKQIYLNTKTPVIEVDDQFRLLRLNNAFTEVFGLSDERLNDLSDNELYLLDFLFFEETEQEVKEHILKRRRGTAEIFHCHAAEKEELFVQMNVYELVSGKGQTSFQIVFNDLTARIRRDREFYRQKRVDLMEKMARIIAHEVRNPLTNIILSAEQLLPELDEVNQTYAQIIRRNADRIEDLIGKFLYTFRFPNVVKEKTSLTSLLEECRFGFEDKALLFEVQFSIEVEDDIPEIEIDKEKILLVLNNLVNNAIQACEDTEDAKIVLRAEINDAYLNVSVNDNGKGIAEEDMDSLFEPFFTRKNSGLGLGLTTSLNIINSHDGTIKAENNEAGGATFHIVLPFD